MLTFVLILKKFSSIVLAFLLLFSNFSFSLTTHICGGHAKEHAISFSKADLSCSPKEQASAFRCQDDKLQHEFTQKPCCENLHQFVQAELGEQVKSEHQSINFSFFTSIISIEELFSQREQKLFPNFCTHPPPFFRESMQVLFQVFRL